MKGSVLVAVLSLAAVALAHEAADESHPIAQYLSTADSELSYCQTCTFGMIKSSALKHGFEIEGMIREAGLQIESSMSLWMSQRLLKELYAEHAGAKWFGELEESLVGYPVRVFVLSGGESRSDAVKMWRELMGPTDPAAARMANPNSIRARFALNKTENAVHGSESPAAAEREMRLFLEVNPIEGFDADKTEKFFELP